MSPCKGSSGDISSSIDIASGEVASSCSMVYCPSSDGYPNDLSIIAEGLCAPAYCFWRSANCLRCNARAEVRVGCGVNAPASSEELLENKRGSIASCSHGDVDECWEYDGNCWAWVCVERGAGDG